jgi:hypothetical protein
VEISFIPVLAERYLRKLTSVIPIDKIRGAAQVN